MKVPLRAQQRNGKQTRACSSVGRALRSQCRGREFESHQVHQPFAGKTRPFVVKTTIWHASPGSILGYATSMHLGE